MANFNIDYLVVAGGGGGGGSAWTTGGASGGGGGAGEYLYQTSQNIFTSTFYSVTVGGGGVASGYGTAAGQGSDSVFNTVTVNGGGRGASGNGLPYNTETIGGDGGSGGGGAAAPSSNTPAAGGSSVLQSGGLGSTGGSFSSRGTRWGAGGGGGATSNGINGNSSDGGHGGDGATNAITGTNTTYAGGGGGGTFDGGSTYAGSGGTGGGGSASSTTGGNGISSTGGGGGGGSYASPNHYEGGAGGSGIVILRYATADVASYAVTGAAPTEDTTTVAGQTILSFTTVGTGTITFTAPTTPTFDGTKVTTPVTGFQSAVDIGLKIPVGTNSNLPTGVEGMIRNDTEEVSGGTNSTTAITFYNGTDWKYFTSTESPNVVYPASLKMFLDANNATSNPGSGTIWTDLTANSNNGALVGSTFTSGTPKYVNIPGTDGSSTRVNLAGSGGTSQVTNLVGGTQPLTVQGYVYFSSSGSGYDYFFCLGNGGGGTIVSIAKEYNGRLYIYEGTSALFSTYTPSMNTWYNMALTVTGTQYKLYINGVLEYSPAGASKNITTNTAQIGSYSSNSTSYGNNLTGRVGEFRIYHDVLSAADILANFNATKATYGL